MNRRIPALALLPLLACAPAPRAQSTTAGSPLALQTTDLQIARRFLRSFGSSATVTQPAAGAVIVTALDDGGGAFVDTAAGTDWVRLEARPAMLLDLYAGPYEQATGWARAALGMGLSQAGIDARQARELLDALLAFPTQLELLELVIPSKPQAKDDLDMTLRIVPRQGTWAADTVALLRPSPDGLRRLPVDAPLLRVDIDVDLPRALPKLLPVLLPLTTMTEKDAEKREEARSLSERMYAGLSGGISVAWSADTGAAMLFGCRDAAAVGAVLHSEAWRAIAERAAAGSRQYEATFEQEAFRYQDVPVSRQVLEFDDPNMAAVLPDGRFESLQAVAGDSFCTTMLHGAETSIRTLVDEALAGRPARTGLGQGVLMRAQIRLAELGGLVSDMVAGAGAPMPASLAELPDVLRIQCSTSDSGMLLRIRTE
ncbi:MAG: hypothetical protein IPM29_24080 [Planctomycetes bacterium]|nr:hypothetical protein [Planctomycetota bacterium]